MNAADRLTLLFCLAAGDVTWDEAKNLGWKALKRIETIVPGEEWL